jgi:hypothetical protein
MQRGRVASFVGLLLVAVLLVAGCAPRAMGGQVAERAGDAQVVVDLPALVLDVQPDGTATVGGTALSSLPMVGQALSAVKFPAESVAQLTGSNIQHIQVDNTADGILILINGKAIPSLAWDGESLTATGEVVKSLPGAAGAVAVLDKLLPLIQNLGIGVIIRFPVTEGAEALPLVSPDAGKTAEELKAAQDQFLAAVQVPATVQVTLTYDENGNWTMGGMSQEEWAQISPQFGTMLTMQPAGIGALKGLGIQEIGISTNKDGIFISINGKTLPHITWAEGRINNILALLAETGALDKVMPGQDSAAILEYIQGLLPAVLASNINLIVKFPS